MSKSTKTLSLPRNLIRIGTKSKSWTDWAILSGINRVTLIARHNALLAAGECGKDWAPKEILNPVKSWRD